MSQRISRQAVYKLTPRHAKNIGASGRSSGLYRA